MLPNLDPDLLKTLQKTSQFTKLCMQSTAINKAAAVWNTSNKHMQIPAIAKAFDHPAIRKQIQNWDEISKRLHKLYPPAYFEQVDRLNKAIAKVPSLDQIRSNSATKREQALLLAQRGWFIPNDMALGKAFDLLKQIKAGNLDEVEQTIEDHLQAELPEIEKSLTSCFPDIADYLTIAFNHYKQSDYYSFLCTFFPLIDNIGRRVLGWSPFYKPKTKELRPVLDLLYENDLIFGWHWSLLKEDLPINADTKKPHAYVEPANRHDFMHGDNLTANRRRCLKAISFLEYIQLFPVRRLSEIEKIHSSSKATEKKAPCPKRKRRGWSK